MTCFRRDDGSSERRELDRLHGEQAAEGLDSLPEGAQRLLDEALGLLWKSPLYTHRGRRYRGKRSRLINDYVSKHTAHMIREWFTVKDDDIDTSDPDVFTFTYDVLRTDKAELVKVTNRLNQADVDFWVFLWLLKADGLPWKYRRVLVDDGSSSADHNYNGAYWHQNRIAKLRVCKQEKEQRAAERQRIEHLTAIANGITINYRSSEGGPISANEESFYPAFASQMRQYGFNESDVFDALSALSELVRKSRQFLTRLTGPMVQQFEARVLLSYCERDRQARESAAAATKRDDSDYDFRQYLAKIYGQLLQFWINPPRKRPNNEADWGSAIAVLVQEAAKIMLVH